MPRTFLSMGFIALASPSPPPPPPTSPLQGFMHVEMTGGFGICNMHSFSPLYPVVRGACTERRCSAVH